MNAKEAMQTVSSLHELRVKSELNDDGQVQVSISDSGTGISSSDIARIFNPMFTTKPSGMGMGLSICRSIIEEHGGRIWAMAGSTSGSIFYFTLPAG
jgi:signal transduction histidine kinase